MGDLIEIFDGCGWIIESGNPVQLAKTVQYVLSNSKKVEKIGWKVG